jgi:hypothetical protein
MKYKIWYMRPEFFRDATMGYRWLEEEGRVPDPANLEKTHIFLKDINSKGLETVFMAMQGENWSPNGEARPLIEEKGLRHTSMSVGDIAVDEAGKAWLVDRFGFKELPAKVAV